MKRTLTVALLLSVPMVFSASAVKVPQAIFVLLFSVLNLNPYLAALGMLAPFVLLQFGGFVDPTLFLTILGL